MKARILAIALATVFGLILQATILAGFDPFGLGLRPDLVLIVVVTCGLLRGPWYGAAVGLAAGLVADLFVGGVLGLGALAKMVTGFLAGLFEKLIFKDNLLVPAIAVFFGTFAAEAIFLSIRSALGWPAGSLSHLLLRLVLLAAYNAFLAPFVYRPFYRLEGRFAVD